MSLEQKINYQLNKVPWVKEYIKRAYQLGCYAVSKKIKSEGNIIKISPDDPTNEYFFGYYDKSPWDATMRYMICMKAKDTWSTPDPLGTADLLLIDTKASNRVKHIATTHMECATRMYGPMAGTRLQVSHTV